PYILIGDPTFKPTIENQLPASSVEKLSDLNYKLNLFIGNYGSTYEGNYYSENYNTLNTIFHDYINVKVGPFEEGTRIASIKQKDFEVMPEADIEDGEYFYYLHKYKDDVVATGQDELIAENLYLDLTTEAVDLSIDSFSYEMIDDSAKVTFVISNKGNMPLDTDANSYLNLQCADQDYNTLYNYYNSFSVNLPFLPAQTQEIVADTGINLNECTHYYIGANIRTNNYLVEFDKTNNYWGDSSHW
ncbi:MAG: hypothetical protein Q8L29_02355, partial [archaeon]|nr:hypothetical protein [archaeon]